MPRAGYGMEGGFAPPQVALLKVALLQVALPKSHRPKSERPRGDVCTHSDFISAFGWRGATGIRPCHYRNERAFAVAFNEGDVPELAAAQDVSCSDLVVYGQSVVIKSH